MILHLAELSLRRNLKRLLPTGLVLVFVFALMLVANSVFTSSVRGFRDLYIDYFTGEYAVAPTEGDSFTVFGSEALLVGEFRVPPTLVEAETLIERLSQLPTGNAVGLVSALGRLRVGHASSDHVVFGVNFEEYFRAFPNIQITRGSLPSTDRPAVFLQENHYDDIATRLGREPEIGEPVLLTSAGYGSFSIREAVLAGTIVYPKTGIATERVVLASADVARGLNGHLYGRNVVADDEITDDLLTSDVDGLFGGSPELANETERENDDSLIDEVEDLFMQRDSEPDVDEGLAGSWNFVLLRSDLSKAEVSRLLPVGPYRLLDWREAAGGFVRLADILQGAMNAGLVFVIFAAVAVASNGVTLSVLERRTQIATLRALGARPRQVAMMIVLETTAFVTAATVLGVVFGVVGSAVLNGAKIEIINEVLSQVFIEGRLTALVTIESVAAHVVVAIALATGATILPLRRVLAISPLLAMAGEDRRV